MCTWMRGPAQSGMSVKIINICIKKKNCHQKQKRKIELAAYSPEQNAIIKACYDNRNKQGK